MIGTGVVGAPFLHQYYGSWGPWTVEQILKILG